MAGHYPIQATDLHIKAVKWFLKKHDVKKLKYFDRIPIGRGAYIQRLTPEYQMNEYHGKIDNEILSLVYNGIIHEIHLDSENKINQIYEVL